MYNMSRVTTQNRWTSTIILKSLLETVKDFCENEKNGFSNPSQFINYAVRRELEIRKRGY